jgi:hypothetical protein
MASIVRDGPSKRAEEYPFDEYRTWIVRDNVLSRLEDGEGEDDSPVIEQVPRHPTIEEAMRHGPMYMVII